MAIARCVGCASNVTMGASIVFTHGPGVAMRCRHENVIAALHMFD
jgi:hypothetical protein